MESAGKALEKNSKINSVLFKYTHGHTLQVGRNSEGFLCRVLAEKLCFAMMLFSGRKNFVPQYHLLLHGKAPYDVSYLQDTNFTVITKHSREGCALAAADNCLPI